jgi:hypothetical protein
MPLLYDCYPISDLKVIPVSHIITRACLVPMFLNGGCEHPTIPYQYRNATKQHFRGGQADTATPTGKGSKLYALNMYAMTFGRAKERTQSLDEQLSKSAARKEAHYAKAASKRRETWAQKAKANWRPSA